MKYITDINQLDLNGTYSYADYLTWRFEQSVELIKGKIFKMSPAPNEKHQRISSRLHTDIGYFFKKHSKCSLYSAPFDVRLLNSKKSKKANKEIYTVVQPDICVICDRSKIDEKGCLGAPDLIVEILSPGNSKKEMKTKFELYQESGVREYWIVFPSEHVLQQFVLDENEKYQLKNSFTEDEVFNAHIFPDLQIDLKEIFEE
jgi:Uma2 family endonuclease